MLQSSMQISRVTFNKYLHEADEYNRQHQLYLEEKKKIDAKMKDKKPFSSMVFGEKPFNTDRLMFNDNKEETIV